MGDDPDSITLLCLRRLDATMDHVLEDMSDVKHRTTAVEIQIGQLVETEASHYAGVSSRLDRMETRLDRIERRLDLVTPA